MTNEDRQAVTQREAFEAWQLSRKPSYPAEWEAWQAATAAERERAAKVCERERMVRGGEVFAAEIRRG